MIEYHRNNNKAFPNAFFAVIHDTTGAYVDRYVCFSCKTIYVATLGNAANNIFKHYRDDHGFTVAG